MADSSLTIAQQEFRKSVRLFAREHLSTARDTYSLATSASQWQERFRSTKPIYQAAVAAGLLKAQIPAPLGGTSAGFVDMALMVEELYSVDTSASLTILGTGLGLTPLIFGGTPELQKKFLAPFLSGEGAPLASLVFSEPWGSANFADDSGEGFRTTAVEDGDHYILNGEKASNIDGSKMEANESRSGLLTAPAGMIAALTYTVSSAESRVLHVAFAQKSHCCLSLATTSPPTSPKPTPSSSIHLH